MNDPSQQLHYLARRLHADGTDPLDLTLEVSRLNQQLGRPVLAAVDVVRQLPGLERFGAVTAWQERWADPAYEAEMVRQWKATPEYQAELRRPPSAPALSPEERRRRDRIKRTAGMVAEGIDVLRPVVVDIVRDVLADDLPGALAALRERGGDAK